MERAALADAEAANRRHDTSTARSLKLDASKNEAGQGAETTGVEEHAAPASDDAPAQDGEGSDEDGRSGSEGD